MVGSLALLFNQLYEVMRRQSVILLVSLNDADSASMSSLSKDLKRVPSGGDGVSITSGLGRRQLPELVAPLY